MLGDGTRTHATVVAIYTRALGFGDALLAPELAAGHQTSPLLGTILVQTGDPAAVARRLRALAAALPGTAGERPRLAGHRDRRRPRDEPLARPAVRRDHLRLHVDRRGQHADDDRAAARPRARRSCGSSAAPPGQVRSMARWEAGLIIAIGLGRRPGDRGHGAAAAQPRADRQPPSVRAARPARGDPRRLGAAGAAGPGAADAAGAAHAAGRGDRCGGVTEVLPRAG